MYAPTWERGGGRQLPRPGNSGITGRNESLDSASHFNILSPDSHQGQSSPTLDRGMQEGDAAPALIVTSLRVDHGRINVVEQLEIVRFSVLHF